MKRMPISLLLVKRMAKASILDGMIGMSYCQRLDYVVQGFGYPNFSAFKRCSESPINCCCYCFYKENL